MAIQVPYNFHGVQLPAAYITLLRPLADKGNKFINISFAVYASLAAYQAGELAIDSVTLNEREEFDGVDWGTLGTWAWGYDKLKQLPEFAGAVDV